MGKYLFEIRITKFDRERFKTKRFGSEWKTSLEDAVKHVEGTVESLYFALGDVDAFLVAEVPKEASVAELALKILEGGDATLRTVVLVDTNALNNGFLHEWKWRPPGTPPPPPPPPPPPKG